MARITQGLRGAVGIEWGLKALLILNLVDAGCTLTWCLKGLATESNPLMDRLLTVGPVAFVEAKVALVLGGVAILWRAKGHALTGVGVASSLVAYVWIAGMHVAEIVRLAVA